MLTIDNYDDLIKKTLKNDVKYKANKFFLPKNPFHSLIIGSTGSGKTSLLLNMLLKWMKFDKVILCAKMKEEDKYQFLEKFFTDVSKQTKLPINNYFESYNNLQELPDVSTYENDGTTKIIIFDDMVNEKDQNKILDYFIAGRKKGFSCMYLSQRFTNIPKVIRNNCHLYIIYAQRPKEVGIIYQDLINGDMDLKEFRTLFNTFTKKKYDFMVIDMTLPNELKFRKNFNTFYINDKN